VLSKSGNTCADLEHGLHAALSGKSLCRDDLIDGAKFGVCVSTRATDRRRASTVSVSRYRTSPNRRVRQRTE